MKSYRHLSKINMREPKSHASSVSNFLPYTPRLQMLSAHNPQHSARSGPPAVVASQPAAPGTFPPGTKVRVGDWTVTIDKFLSQGGYAHVYIGSSSEPISGAKHHVLKRIAVPNKEELKGVRKEVDIMKQLKPHPNIVAIYEACASPLHNVPNAYEVFILMEFCQGGGIIDFLNSRLNNRLGEFEILHIFGDVCKAVAHMHAQKPPLIHRDLKIENVLLSTSPSGKPMYKLCDFGSSSTPTNTPQSVNEIQEIEADINKYTTLQYRSPEMCDIWSRKAIGPPSDIWALGVLLYKLCYYTTPFEPHGVLAIQNVRYTIPDFPAYSDNIKNVIRIILQENPHRRPNIAQLHEHICKLQGVSPDPAIMKFKAELSTKASQERKLPGEPMKSQNSSPQVLVEQASSDLYSNSKNLAQAIPPMRRGRPPKSSATNSSPPTPKNNEDSFKSFTEPKQSATQSGRERDNGNDNQYPIIVKSKNAPSNHFFPSHFNNSLAHSKSFDSKPPSSGFDDDFASLKLSSNNTPSASLQQVSSSISPSFDDDFSSIKLPTASASPSYTPITDTQDASNKPLPVPTERTSSAKSISRSNNTLQQQPSNKSQPSGPGFDDDFGISAAYTNPDNKKDPQVATKSSTSILNLKENFENKDKDKNNVINSKAPIDRGLQTSPELLTNWIKKQDSKEENEEKQDQIPEPVLKSSPTVSSNSTNDTNQNIMDLPNDQLEQEKRQVDSSDDDEGPEDATPMNHYRNIRSFLKEESTMPSVAARPQQASLKSINETSKSSTSFTPAPPPKPQALAQTPKRSSVSVVSSSSNALNNSPPVNDKNVKSLHRNSLMGSQHHRQGSISNLVGRFEPSLSVVEKPPSTGPRQHNVNLSRKPSVPTKPKKSTVAVPLSLPEDALQPQLQEHVQSPSKPSVPPKPRQMSIDMQQQQQQRSKAVPPPIAKKPSGELSKRKVTSPKSGPFSLSPTSSSSPSQEQQFTGSTNKTSPQPDTNNDNNTNDDGDDGERRIEIGKLRDRWESIAASQR